ncbi:extracellular solute-binding protein [Anaerotruncus colihominis]|uniref:extracellular solute-binding protein n=1 Tax=Anaerotruncus colihominis TaxID=169435 RepID=UPI00210A69CE|nr:extracellular solute-binding protein [Anaerotruncus colihominis]
MLSGETSVGYMFTSQVLTVLNENPNFEVVFPKEGLGFGIDSCFIPAKAPHADNAHAFLDKLYSAYDRFFIIRAEAWKNRPHHS